MSPSALRRMALKELRATRRTMLSARWMLTLEKADDETRASAGWELIRVNHAILKLENERLSEIRDGLLENEADLVAGTESLREALGKVERIDEVLESVAEVLEVVARVVAVL